MGWGWIQVGRESGPNTSCLWSGDVEGGPGRGGLVGLVPVGVPVWYCRSFVATGEIGSGLGDGWER